MHAAFKLKEAHMCASFKAASVDLCESLASTTRWQYVDPSGISSLVACWLIALDKCPGVCPIGVGETAQCVIGKAIATSMGGSFLRE